MRTQDRAVVILALGLFATGPGQAQVVETELPPLRATARGHTQRVSRGVFAPDGKRFFSASNDRTIRAWDSANGKELFTLQGHAAPVSALGLAGDNLLVSAGAACTCTKQGPR